MAEPDLALGAKVFKANCTGCHIGGKNALVANKNLGATALHEYHMDSPEAIIAQVTQGKSAMPAFGKQLKPNEIESVAAYVLDQANQGWGKNLA
ncbi:MAG: c-type cytochrome [Synechococcales cyanobacterium]